MSERNRIRALMGTLLALTVIAGAAAPVARGSALAGAQFVVGQATEARLTFRASASGSDWGRSRHEAAVLAIAVDGRVVGDVVAVGGARPTVYRVALGRLESGTHIVSITLDRARSAPAVRQARAGKLRIALAPPSDRVAQYAPILYGRDLPEIPGRFENNHTDAPLLAYHTSSRDAAGRTTIEYSVIWSNEDEGTDAPALMARWGRTTDIEWIYRVTFDRRGRRVSDAYQAPDHASLPFTGARERHHPLLRTATGNNDTLRVTRASAVSRYRFPLDASRSLPAGRAREAMMDANPWTYRVMAREMAREGKLESPASADTPALSDQRDYLFAEVTKATTYPVAPAPGSWVGVALAVQLRGSDRWFTSNHDVPDWSIQRDDPAATTIELPPGTARAAVAAVGAVAVPVGTATAPPPADYRITVTALRRGFLLRRDFLPGKPLLNWSGNVTLSPAASAAVLWRAAAS
jgi:hypothetical protein